MTRTRQYLILAICCGSLLLVSLDATIVNVALPSIARELHSSVPSLQWTVDAYLLVLASLLLLSGSLADRYGRKRLFAIGVAIFTAGSLLCSLAPSDGWLIGFRMFQAVGGSAMTPVALAIVTNIFVLPAARAGAIGIWAAVGGVGIAAGPLLGGLLVDTVGWRSIFWINVPTGVAVVVLTLVMIPESRAGRPRSLDPLGQLFAILVLVGIVFVIIELPRAADMLLLISGAAIIAVGAFVALLLYERTRAEPAIPLPLFRERTFAVAFAVAVLGFLAFSGLLFANTLYLQEVRALPASLAGLLTLPLAVATIVAAPASGRLMARVGARVPLLIAGATMVAAALALIPLTPTGPVLWLVLPYAVFGIGYGMLNAPVNDTAVSDLPDDQAGVAASLISTAKQVGSALGVAIVGSIVAANPTDAFAKAFDARSWIVWTIVAAGGAAVLLLALPRRSTPPLRAQDAVRVN